MGVCVWVWVCVCVCVDGCVWVCVGVGVCVCVCVWKGGQKAQGCYATAWPIINYNRNFFKFN